MSLDRSDWLRDRWTAVRDRWNQIGYENLLRPEQVFVCVWSLEGEVEAGGFDQYFFNSAGHLAFASIVALEEIGVPQSAAVVRQAVRAAPPDSLCEDLQERRLRIDDWPAETHDAVGALEEPFIALHQERADAIYQYVQTHASEIGGPG